MRGVEALAQEREKWLTRWVLIKLKPVKEPSVEGSPDSGGSERMFRLTMASLLSAWGSLRLSSLLSGLPYWFELPAITRGPSRS